MKAFLIDSMLLLLGKQSKALQRINRRKAMCKEEIKNNQ